MKQIVALFAALLFFFDTIHLSAQPADHVPGDLLVMLKKNVSAEAFISEFTLFNSSTTTMAVERNLSKRMNIWLCHFDESTIDENELLHAVQQSPLVVLAQFNHYTELRSNPNDASFGSQWNMVNIGQTGGTPDADIDADEAWNYVTGGTTSSGDTIVVAVIDDGFSLTHEDLNFWKNHSEIPNNSIDDDGNGYEDDYDGWNAFLQSDSIPSTTHGSHVSGIAGAKGNNGIGVAGVNWNVQIMPVKGSSGTEAVVLEAYGYVLEQRARFNETDGDSGAFVVSANSSFGVNNGNPQFFPLWCAMYDSMGYYGILHAGATSNAFNADIDVVNDIPTACPSNFLISVTNTNHTDNLQAAYGLTTIDLGAPGASIISTTPTNGYATLSGTSMSSPHVAGAVGLLYSIDCPAFALEYKNDPDGVAQKVKNFMLQGVDVVPDLNGKTVSGGRLNVFKSLQLLGAFYSCPVGIDDVLENEVFSVFPNPAENAIYLEWKKAGWSNASVYITDATGRVLITHVVSTYDLMSIDISRLPTGIYLLRFLSNEVSVALKLMIK